MSRLEAELARLLSRWAGRKRERLLGFEGSPFVGKTTLGRALAAAEGSLFVPEHTDWFPGLRDALGAPWPSEEDAILARQICVLEVEAQRSQHAADALRMGMPVIMDRTFLSPLAYLLARTADHPAQDTIVLAFLSYLDAAVEVGEVLVPAAICHLMCDPSTARRRAGYPGDGLAARGTEAPLMAPHFRLALDDLYATMCRYLEVRYVVLDTAGSPAPARLRSRGGGPSRP